MIIEENISIDLKYCNNENIIIYETNLSWNELNQKNANGGLKMHWTIYSIDVKTQVNGTFVNCIL